jgi:murein DD-endopeptidase MepM/ murein hydrolase activator NlpD
VTRRLLLLALVVTLYGAFAYPAVGADPDSDLDRVREQMAEVRSRISVVASERSALARELIASGEALEDAEREVLAASNEVSIVDVALAARMDSLGAIRAELGEQLASLAETRRLRDDARTEAETWALQAYMGGGTAQPSIAFNATVVNDISVGVAYLDVLTAHSSRAADRYGVLVSEEERQEAEVRRVEESMAEEVRDLETLGSELDRLEEDLRQRREHLATAYAEQVKLLDRLDGEIAHFEGELTALAREESSIRSDIAAASAPTSTPVAGSQSGFVRPVPGAVSSGFGMRIHPITGQNRMHNGVDMNAAHGDPIRSVRSGRVIFAGAKGGYGNTVMVDHGGGMVTLYAHQSRLGATVGANVSAGQVIGYIGSTGQSTGPHLHFEVRMNGVPVNPTKYF